MTDFSLSRVFLPQSRTRIAQSARGGGKPVHRISPLVVLLNNMNATGLVRERVVYAENAFAEWVQWLLPNAQAGSAHNYKYRVADVVDGVCLLRYDNEAGKGDHRHFRRQQGL